MRAKPQTFRNAKILRPFNHSLAGTMVLLLVALSLFPVLLLGSATYIRSREVLREQTELQLQAITQVQAEELEASVSEGKPIIDMMVSDFLLRIMLTNYLDNPEGSNQRSNLNKFLLSYQNSLNDRNANTINDVSLFTPDGQLILSSNETWGSLDFKRNAQIMSALAGEGSTALYNPAPVYIDQLAIFTTRQITDPDKNMQAVLVWTATSPLFRNSLTSSQSFFPSAESFFLTSAGETLKKYPTMEGLEKMADTGDYQQRLEALIEQGKADQSNQFISYDGITPVFGIVRWLPDLQLGYVLQVPEQAIYGQVPIVSSFNLLLLAIALVVSGIIAVIATRSFVTPLLQLAELAQRFTQGEWDKRAHFKRKDEIGQLANAFDHMVDDLTSLYRSMEQKVADRTEEVRLASEVAVLATSANSQNEIINRTVELVVERFQYLYAGVFLIDSSGLFAELEQEKQREPTGQTLFDKRLRLGTESLVGWVAANNQASAITDESESGYFQSTLLSGARTEAAIPITLGNQVIAVLDVQSEKADTFDNDTLSALQSLSNQMASGIQNARLLETAEVNLAETSMLYRTSRQITQAESEAQALGLLKDALASSVYLSGIYELEDERMRVIGIYDAKNPSAVDQIKGLTLPLKEVGEQFKGPGYIRIDDISNQTPFDHVLSFYLRRGCHGAVLFPLFEAGKLARLIVLGERESGQLNEMAIQPFANLIDVAASIFSRFHILKELDERIAELEAATKAYQQEHFLLSSWLENTPDYAYFKDRDGHYIRSGRSYALRFGKSSAEELIGLTDFDLYDPETAQKREQEAQALLESRQREIGFMHEEIDQNGQVSWRLRSRTPLVDGSDQVAGYLSISRDVTDMKKTEEMAQQAARQLTTASEIARDASGTLELSDLLNKAVNLVRERFGFYHASIFLIDASGIYAVLRELTGEVGRIMKEREHKLAVGSRSIVGQSTMLGEPLVVNDVTLTPNYYANPLLPETRAELSIPLKVGSQVLGALDVQSREAGAYGDQEVTILKLLADQIAVAVMNASLYSRSMENLEQHRQMHEITTQAASATTSEEVLTAAVEGLQAMLKNAAVSAYLVSGNELQLQVACGYTENTTAQDRIKAGEGIIGKVLQERRPLLTTSQQDAEASETVYNPYHSYIATPILYSGELVGVLYAASLEFAAFDENTLDLLALLSSSLGAVLSNTQLIATVRKQVDRQQLIYEATSRIHRSVDIQTILETSASEIARAVGARKAQIKISPGAAGAGQEDSSAEAKVNGNGHGNGHCDGKEILK